MSFPANWVLYSMIFSLMVFTVFRNISSSFGRTFSRYVRSAIRTVTGINSFMTCILQFDCLISFPLCKLTLNFEYHLHQFLSLNKHQLKLYPCSPKLSQQSLLTRSNLS